MPRRPTLPFRRKARTMTRSTPTPDTEAVHFPDVEADPRVLAEVEKHNTIMRRLHALEDELEAIPASATNTQQRAEMILEGRDPNAEDAIKVRDRRRIAQDIADHERAAKMQEKRIEDARVLVRREARLALMPHHARLAHGIAAALDHLADALAAELAFCDELYRHGIEHGAPMQSGTLMMNGRVGKESIDNLRVEAGTLRANHPLQ